MGNTHGALYRCADDGFQITIEAKEEPAESAAKDKLRGDNPRQYTLNLNVRPERESVAFNQSIKKFFGMVNIEAPLCESLERAAIDIFCVVDTSGSMSGDRISLLRKSMRRLVRGVQSKDRLAIVEFCDNYQILLALTKMDEKGKERAKTVVKNLKARGGTHLSGGLLESLKMVKRRIPGEANEVCSILLFTDGEANTGIRDTKGIVAAAEQEAGLANLSRIMPSGDPEKWSVKDVCQWLAFKEMDVEDLVGNVTRLKVDGQILMHDLTEEMLEEDLKVSRLHTAKFLREIENLREGHEETVEKQDVQLECTINTFGFGSNHNSDLLEKLAERFDGMYYFVADTDAINESFATCLGGLMSTVATNLQLQVKPLSGAANVKILNDFVVRTQVDVVSANLGDIQSEEKRHILFEMDLPEAKTESSAQNYCSVKLNYENTITSKTDVLLSSMELKREKLTAKRDDVVDEQYNRVVVSQALHRADALGRAGQLEKARASLDTAMITVRSSRSSGTPMSRTLLNDMTETKKGYGTLRDYKKWGKQLTKTKRSSCRRERSVRISSHRSGQYAMSRSYAKASQIKAVVQFKNRCSDDSDSEEEKKTNRRTRSVSLRGSKTPKPRAQPRHSIHARARRPQTVGGQSVPQLNFKKRSKRKFRKTSSKKVTSAKAPPKWRPYKKPQASKLSSGSITPMAVFFSKKPVPAEQKSVPDTSMVFKSKPPKASLDIVTKPVTFESPKSSVDTEQRSVMDTAQVAWSKPTEGSVVTLSEPASGSVKRSTNAERKLITDIPQVTKSKTPNGSLATRTKPLSSDLAVEQKSATDIPQVTKSKQHNGSLATLTRPVTSESTKKQVEAVIPQTDESEQPNGSLAALTKPVTSESLKRSLDEAEPSLVQDNNIKQKEEVKESLIV